MKQVQTDSGKHGEIGETSSNRLRKTCKFIYIQPLLGSPKSVKQIQTDSGKYDEINVQHFGTHFVP